VSRVRFTAKAREDLLDIWVYIAAQISPAIADDVFDKIERACRLLEDQPRLGRVRPEIHAEARSLVMERWLALYRIDTGCVELVRVIDGARDLESIEWLL
jgi:toxin ParE1/3/4